MTVRPTAIPGSEPPRLLPQFRRTVLSLMLLHVAISSGGYLFVKVGLSEFSSLAFAFWRFVIGLAGLVTATLVLRAWPKVERQDWPRIFLLAALAVPANQLMYLSGMKYSVPSSTPVMVPSPLFT